MSRDALREAIAMEGTGGVAAGVPGCKGREMIIPSSIRKIDPGVAPPCRVRRGGGRACVVNPAGRPQGRVHAAERDPPSRRKGDRASDVKLTSNDVTDKDGGTCRRKTPLARLWHIPKQ